MRFAWNYVLSPVWCARYLYTLLPNIAFAGCALGYMGLEWLLRFERPLAWSLVVYNMTRGYRLPLHKMCNCAPALLVACRCPSWAVDAKFCIALEAWLSAAYLTSIAACVL